MIFLWYSSPGCVMTAHFPRQGAKIRDVRGSVDGGKGGVWDRMSQSHVMLSLIQVRWRKTRWTMKRFSLRIGKW